MRSTVPSTGVPPLPREISFDTWVQTFQREYDWLCARVDRDEPTWLDPYASEEPSEFFAVCVETFFDVPRELRAEHPELYALLAAFFKQDPAQA